VRPLSFVEGPETCKFRGRSAQTERL
jgi:hypothetical protein